MTAQCGRCKNEAFELRLVNVAGSENGVPLVICSGCGSVVGVEPQNLAAELRKLSNEVQFVLRRVEETTTNHDYTFNNKINELEAELINLRYQLSR